MIGFGSRSLPRLTARGIAGVAGCGVASAGKGTADSGDGMSDNRGGEEGVGGLWRTDEHWPGVSATKPGRTNPSVVGFSAAPRSRTCSPGVAEWKTTGFRKIFRFCQVCGICRRYLQR